MITPSDLEKARATLVVELSEVIPNQILDCERIAQAIDHLIQLHLAIRGVTWSGAVVKKVKLPDRVMDTYGWLVVGPGHVPIKKLFRFKSEAVKDAKKRKISVKQIYPVVVSVCEVTPGHCGYAEEPPKELPRCFECGCYESTHPISVCAVFIPETNTPKVR